MLNNDKDNSESDSDDAVINEAAKTVKYKAARVNKSSHEFDRSQIIQILNPNSGPNAINSSILTPTTPSGGNFPGSNQSPVNLPSPTSASSSSNSNNVEFCFSKIVLLFNTNLFNFLVHYLVDEVFSLWKAIGKYFRPIQRIIVLSIKEINYIGDRWKGSGHTNLGS